jgi:hypothetical protein
MLMNVFRETADGKGITHNAVSRLLVEEPVLSDWLSYSLDESWPAAAKAVDAIGKWPDCDEPRNTVGLRGLFFAIVNKMTDAVDKGLFSC